MKKLALWGLWHVHAEHYVQLASKYAEVTGVWEENKVWQSDFCQKHGLYAYSSLEEMLSSDVEGVIVCTETSKHKEVICTIAKAGKHVFTEKVLAITDEDAKEIADTVKSSGILFAISFPNIAYGFTQTAKELIASGELGKINSVRFKYSHSGSSADWLPEHFYDRDTCGGGCLIDHGVHGLSVIYHLCGIPERFKSMLTVSTSNENAAAKNRDNVEDCSVALMSYSDGCIAISECSSVTFAPVTLEINGENGMYFFSCDTMRKKTRDTDFEVIKETKSLPHPLKQFIDEDIDPAFGVDTGVAVTYMVNRLYENK